jgi:DNA modification methylase
MNENSGMREINIENLNADWSFPNSIIEIPAVVSNSKELENHSTQKPIRLYEYFLKTYTKKGDTVFDPFGGSGPLVDACLRLDRNFIIIEREKKYINMIKQRVRKFFKNSITFTQKNESNCIIYEYKKPFDEFL